MAATAPFQDRSTIFELQEPGGVTPQKLANFNDYLSAYKADGLNTITLVTWIPVDPNTGQIESSFNDPRNGETAETPEYLAAFTDAAHAAGMNVIWKPQFVLDNGTNNNVDDWALGPNFYPNGTNFNVNTFLSGVQQFWSQWAPVAQQHNVQMLILGTEQGQFASSPYTQNWLNIIQSVRSVYSGELTYAENHFGPQSWEPNVQFWGALDFIGIDDYAPIGNGTANTPYSYAVAHIFQTPLDQVGPNYTPESVPGILYNLHTEFNKPIFLTEFGTTSIDGAMNNPAMTLTGNINYSEQSTYFEANLDVLQSYNWIQGISIWNNENEFSPGPSSSNWSAYFSQYVAGGYEFLGKPTEALLKSYWATGAPSPQVDLFIASESKTGDYYLGYVIDDQGKYSTGSGFTSGTTDQAGGNWTYYVYGTTATTPGQAADNGYVYHTGYWDNDAQTGYAPVYSVAGTNFLGTDTDFINVNGTVLEYGGGTYVLPDVKIDYFIASESKTGDYYLGYVIDAQGQYSKGSGFTSSTTDQAGGKWTHYVYNTASTTPNMASLNGYVYETGYWDADASTGYTPYYSVAGTSFLGTDVDYIKVNGSFLKYGGGSYVVPDVKIDYFIASESKSGDYYLGYVIDAQGQYSKGSGFTASTTDQAGGKWSYYVYATASTTANLASQNGYVYDTGYWDAAVSTGYAPYYAVSGTNFLGSDTDWIVQNGQLKEYGQEYYVASAADPLLLSLDRQDINLLPAGSVPFDFNGTGQKTPTGWMGSDTGMLVLDTDGKGILGSGTSIVEGFSELDMLAPGTNGVINATDPIFTQLQVWNDTNEDGTIEQGELHSLASLGIQSIDFNSVPVTEVIGGNSVTAVGTVTFTDGTTERLDDVTYGSATGGNPLTVGPAATLELPGASNAIVDFSGTTGTLRLDDSTAFKGQIQGFGATDHIDLADISFGSTTTLGFAPNNGNTGSNLAISDGTHTANLALLGQYAASSFVITSDGHGGTLLQEATAISTATLGMQLTQPHA
jgi:hypothetical protein